MPDPPPIAGAALRVGVHLDRLRRRQPLRRAAGPQAREDLGGVPPEASGLDTRRAALADRTPVPLTILARPDGKPWKVNDFQKAAGKAIRAAGFSEVVWHGLRGSAANWPPMAVQQDRNTFSCGRFNFQSTYCSSPLPSALPSPLPSGLPSGFDSGLPSVLLSAIVVLPLMVYGYPLDGAFFLPAIVLRGPLRVRAFVRVRCPRTGNCLRCRSPR